MRQLCVEPSGAVLARGADRRAEEVKHLQPHPEERAPKSGLPDFGN